MRARRCPICRKPVTSEAAASLGPFCSERCKAIDLGQWLTESYRVPEEDDDGERTTNTGDSPEDWDA